MNERSKKRLTALVVLSYIFIGFQLLSQTFAVLSGPMTDEQLRQAKLDMLTGQTEETINAMKGTFDDLMQIQEVTRDNLYTIAGLTIFAALIGLVGVFMLFKLKKLGFHFYIIYSIFYVGISSYFFHEFSIAIAGILIESLIAALFVFFYSRFIKYMN